MCGIVGYVGPKPAVEIIVNGLRRLEYRGYDSAGVAVVGPGGLAVQRSKGKLQNLVSLLAEHPLAGSTGVGHTRWATHGRPSDENAHPHAYKGVAVVHNGIIENHLELKASLQGKGHRFSSETDTEIFAHLIADALQAGAEDLAGAVRAALSVWVRALPHAIEISLPPSTRSRLAPSKARGARMSVAWEDVERIPGSARAVLVDAALLLLGMSLDALREGGGLRFFDPDTAEVLRAADVMASGVAETPEGAGG